MSTAKQKREEQERIRGARASLIRADILELGVASALSVGPTLKARPYLGNRSEKTLICASVLEEAAAIREPAEIYLDSLETPAIRRPRSGKDAAAGKD